MGARGRVPTPTAVLKLHDSWRAKRREKDGEVQPEPGVPVAPAFASEDERALWEFVVGEIDKTPGLLTIVDGFQLERYCRTLARWRRIDRVLAGIEEDVIGALTDFVRRQVIRSLWLEYRACDHDLKQTEDRYGLTPSARSRIRLTGNLADAAKSASGKDGERFFKRG